MKRYLSYGGGVNSTALMLWLLDQGEEFETVFVDHGGDYPETYAYLEMMQAKGYAITVVKPDQRGMSDLYAYSWHYEMIPNRRPRWCTARFKVEPLERHFGTSERIVYIGIHAGEARRAKPSQYPHERKQYPLVDNDIDQQGCIDIIEAHGLPVPPRSGCYFCPFATIQQVRDLAKRNDGLFCKVAALEARAIAARARRGNTTPFTIYRKPLQQIVDPSWTPDAQTLWEEARPCECGL